MPTSLPQRTLGRHGPSVSAIGLGCMGMSDFYGPSETSTNLAVLHHALDIGVNFLDTADMYGVGEQGMGAAMRSSWRRNSAMSAALTANFWA
jgi:aryl-alcohol dehydrogenase-like predicted oxidoreductase